MIVIKRDDIELFDFNLLVLADLSTEQYEFLVQLNRQLLEIEKNLNRETEELIVLGDKKVLKHNSWIEDYEIEGRISYILDVTDTAFNDDNDNILHVQDTQISKYQANGLEIYKSWDVGEPFDKPDFPFSYLFYMLVYHSELGLANILRVGEIWVDTYLNYQQCISIRDATNDS